MKRHKVLVIFVSALMASAAVSADDHVIIERTISFVGSKLPSRRTEYWLNETSVYIKGGRYIKIERDDLQKRWTLSPDKKRYFEEALVATAVPKSVKDTVAI